MNQEKIGQFIKDLRKKNNLTQKDLADKYGVTYQAVSKWENGKNIPDISLIRQMSKDFNISVEDILDGNTTGVKKHKSKNYIYVLIVIFIFIIIGVVLISKNNSTYNFKTISTTCDDFNVTGSIAYDKDRASIFISNIDYCGENNNTKYKSIECNLYEKNNNTNTLISNYKVENDITLDDYLKEIKLNIDDYLNVCKEYSDDSLYLEISATDYKNTITTFKIPLKLNDNCE